MYGTIATVLALAALGSAKPASNSRTFAVNYFYGSEPLLEGRYDPNVSPGQVSGHVHTIMGGNAFNMEMGDDTALKSTCTNSKVKADNSNYWWPKLYFHDEANNTFEDVHLFYAKIYYFSEPTDDEVKAFPAGLRMTTGSPNKRSPPSGTDLVIDKSQGDINPVQFMCSTKDQGIKPFAQPESSDNFRGAAFPDAECDQYATPMRYDLHFPSCYNPAVDVKDHENNMDWPTNNNCPDGWTHTPHVFMEVYWDTPKFAGRWTPGQGKSPWVLAQGDPTGYGLHGDFLAGWDENALQNLIDDCDSGNAGFQECPNINQNGGVNADGESCTVKPFIDEQVTGPMEKLPGCNPITEGPEDAVPQTGGDCSGAASSGGSDNDDSSSSDSAAPASSAAAVDGNDRAASTPTTPSTPTTLSTAPASAKQTPATQPEANAQSPAQAFAEDESGHVVWATEVVVNKVYVTATPQPRFMRARRHAHGNVHKRD